jgi:hypothetical protein
MYQCSLEAKLESSRNRVFDRASRLRHILR